MGLMMLWLAAGCGLPQCDALCEARAACVRDDIDVSGSTWEEWTGFPDEAGYRDACQRQFHDSWEDGAKKDDLEDLCDAEGTDSCEPE